MPVTKAQIRRARIIGHQVDFGDGVAVTFWYDRNKITDAWIKDWREQEQQTNTPALNEMLADLIDRWDILETEGGPVMAVTADTVGELFSLPDKLQLCQELMTASVPASEEGNDSGITSSGQSQSSSSEQASLRNGQEPSPSQTPSASPSPT